MINLFIFSRPPCVKGAVSAADWGIQKKKEDILSNVLFVLALPIFPGASACQVSWTDTSLTDLSRDGVPSRTMKKERGRSFDRPLRVGVTYFPGPSPAKYRGQKRA